MEECNAYKKGNILWYYFIYYRNEFILVAIMIQVAKIRNANIQINYIQYFLIYIFALFFRVEIKPNS